MNILIPVLIMTLILYFILSRELQILKIDSPNGSVSKKVSFVVSTRAKIASWIFLQNIELFVRKIVKIKSADFSIPFHGLLNSVMLK